MLQCDSQCIKKTEVSCRKCDWARWSASSCGCGQKSWKGIWCHKSRYTCHDETTLNNNPCDDGKHDTIGDYCMNGQCISGKKIEETGISLPFEDLE